MKDSEGRSGSEETIMLDFGCFRQASGARGVYVENDVTGVHPSADTLIRVIRVTRVILYWSGVSFGG